MIHYVERQIPEPCQNGYHSFSEVVVFGPQGSFVTCNGCGKSPQEVSQYKGTHAQYYAQKSMEDSKEEATNYKEDRSMDTVKAVKCSVCGELKEVESNNFLRFKGNFSEDEEVSELEERIVCKNSDCLRKLVQELSGVAIPKNIEIDDDSFPLPDSDPHPQPMRPWYDHETDETPDFDRNTGPYMHDNTNHEIMNVN
jgi:hypothetical protein